jgi:DNA (cytosine-5)-methyltransferase 1
MRGATSERKLTAIDLFCGAGGLSLGLRQAGFEVLGAVEISDLAARTYRLNHRTTTLWHQNIRSLRPQTVMTTLNLKPGDLDLLAACPPCQGFSSMRTLLRATSVDDKRNSLVAQFGRYAEALRPKALMLENVPGLASDPRLERLLKRLRRLGYRITSEVLDAADYSVPQRRRRFVMIGMLGQTVEFAPKAARMRTVRDAIGSLVPPLASTDPMHTHGEHRSAAVQHRIAAIPRDGGSLRHAGEEHTLACRRRLKGFNDVYGRMAWDSPAPTITSGCVNPSKGRFLHPVHDRAITLREAALLQSFPKSYRFPKDAPKFPVADLIGNALPPKFVAAHARQLARALLAQREADALEAT